MALVRINRHPPDAQLRVFAVLWLGFLGAAGAAAWRHGSTGLAGALWAAAALVAAAGLAAPRTVRPVYLAACYAALPVGLAVSFVLLAAVYYLVFTPVGLLLRLAGRDPLARRFAPGAAGYWMPRGAARSPESYFRQY